jgi:hypothetical protein
MTCLRGLWWTPAFGLPSGDTLEIWVNDQTPPIPWTWRSGWVVVE